MSKKSKKRVSKAANKIVTGLQEALTIATAETGRPTERAMGLAESFLTRSRSKALRELTVLQIAEMIDATLRVERSHGVSEGLGRGHKAADEAREREIIEGFLCRVQYAVGNAKQPAKVVILSASDAMVIAHKLESIGFTGFRRVRDGEWGTVALEAKTADAFQHRQ